MYIRWSADSAVVHDDIDASVYNGVKKGFYQAFHSYLHYWEFRWLKNEVWCECRLQKIVIQLLIGLEIALSSQIF